ncbi:hypothetical protein DM02DRAFT_237013 [Periconia macrospinosa]|uniref:Rhodopsin domain-containing protein n=1 Tax=Periconia macrospinosa TaxID=97972 RepID=A0A2V1EBH2_9PLEO|nr:hypothetical protein DM02DRAFT_237013 [Periconia macrospinosa]
MISPSGVIAIEWSLFTLAMILVCARVSVHIRMRNTTMHLSDTFLMMAVVSALGLLICDTLTYKAGAMTTFQEPTVDIWKVRFATNYVFDFGVYLPKFSMLAFYYRIVPCTAPQTRMALYGITAFILVSSMATLLADTFWCGPDPRVNRSNELTKCTVFTSMALVKMNWALHFTSEIMLFVLPLPLIGGLHLSQRREKTGLLFVFLLGAITIVVSTARFIAMMILSNDIMIYILATAEFTIAIMILSLISLRPLLRRIGHVMSSLSNSASQFLECANNPSNKVSGGRRPGKNPKSSVLSTSIMNSRDPYLYPNQTLSPNAFGSEIELTEQDLGKIYKTEEATITHSRSTQDPDTLSERSRGHGSHEAELRVESIAV